MNGNTLDTNSKLGQPAVSERVIIFLIASVQFISILEFMMVMPLGPDFAEALNIPLGDHIQPQLPSQVSWDPCGSSALTAVRPWHF